MKERKDVDNLADCIVYRIPVHFVPL